MNTSVRGRDASPDGPEKPEPPPPAAPDDREATYISCRMARAYGSIEPEMSHSTTSRRCLIRTARLAIRTGSPPVLVAWRIVRRMSSRAPSFFGRYRLVRRGGTAITSSRMSVASCASSDGESCAKSRSRSRSVREATRRTAGMPSAGSASSSDSASRSRPAPSASASSRPASSGGSSSSVRRVRRGVLAVGALGRLDDHVLLRRGHLGPPRPGGTRAEHLVEHPLERVDLIRRRTPSWRARTRAAAPIVVARITVSAPASRSLRSGPAGSPAVRSAVASIAASAA